MGRTMRTKPAARTEILLPRRQRQVAAAKLTAEQQAARDAERRALLAQHLEAQPPARIAATVAPVPTTFVLHRVRARR